MGAALACSARVLDIALCVLPRARGAATWLSRAGFPAAARHRARCEARHGAQMSVKDLSDTIGASEDSVRLLLAVLAGQTLPQSIASREKSMRTRN